MKCIIEFGKIAYEGKNKANLVELELELNEKEEGRQVFSVFGNVWDKKHTDVRMGGQCVDDIWLEYKDQLKHPELYKQIMELWKKWHLNDMHAECEHQEAKKMTWETHPSNKCEICGWKLGHGWDYREINQKDLETIKTIIKKYSIK